MVMMMIRRRRSRQGKVVEVDVGGDPETGILLSRGSTIVPETAILDVGADPETAMVEKG